MSEQYLPQPYEDATYQSEAWENLKQRIDDCMKEVDRAAGVWRDEE